ncbi:hypothetical protein H2198_006462 [Neophaeococcomyces mojaviensis]|uniref:Uncharacterized protein n=1 Tax=Neophaeococcomyces mojaviensis TaxID=3383035 RepID=A0ACC3A2S2_9EURO|nr:hypothetical protein H2198_006462 [Knufia sp. JES_112]
MSSQPSPIITPTPPLPTRLSLAAQVYGIKAIAATVLGATRVFWRSTYNKFAPTYTKRYPIRPMLECRVFIPKSYKTNQKLPLYIDIHGGGFTIGDPQFDDKVCHYLCNKFGYVVVSLQYRLAPSNPFPIPVDDCTELALAVLSDPDLPVDHSKVAMGGCSAGGGLTLSVSQDPRLKSKIMALVPFYPVTDFSYKFTGDFRDKPAAADGKGAATDGLRNSMHLFDWAYIPYGQDRTDPRLSPIYADAAVFPKKIYFLTAQYDYLCEEAFNMAKKLAGDNSLTEDADWDVNGVRWERLPDEVHAFIETAWKTEFFPEAEGELWKKEIEAVLGRVGAWLDEVFAHNHEPNSG